MRLWSLGLLGILGCAVQSPHPAAATRPGVVWVTNQSGGLRFAYPNSWHPIADDTVLTLVPVDESKIGLHTLVVEVPDLPPHIPFFIPLPLVVSGFVADLKKRYKEVTLLDSADLAVAGSPGHWIRASGRRSAGDVIVLALLCVHGDRVYVIDAESDPAGADAAKAAFDRVVNSIQWMD
jgi:hypothetical protein